ncbi:MAG: YbdK family carboxylate-amine ligase [Thermoleophilia bacterium]|nr:YbdK family carboxylate-amine ligase [Thermoleophilia bacterium]
MGDAQTVPYDQLLREARERFDLGTDLTVSVEEEFALLDPETLDLVNRFEEVYAAAQATELGVNMAGELIASEVEVKTGKQPSALDALAALPERRAELVALVEPMGLALGSTGAHPWASWKDQRIIDTPHYRRNVEILQWVVRKNNTFGLHVHVGVEGADRAIAALDGVRNYLPELLALSSSSPFAEGVDTGLASARTQIFTRFFPRCGIPDTFGDWQGYEDYVRFLYETGSIDEHTQLWWSLRPHLAFPTVEIRICDAQPDAQEAQSLVALAVALVGRVLRAHDEGEPLVVQPHRLLEENLWRAIRRGLEGGLIDLDRGDVLPARARLERLVEWVRPVAEELGIADTIRIPERGPAERQRARLADGASLAEIYGELIVAEPQGAAR